ncbi:MAG TPA: reverse transcriptase family protein [Candidatus Cloacimonadota bacterium]|nr:reverse transcriptase family protein [Candidatus Cloacimonadota bacterium]
MELLHIKLFNLLKNDIKFPKYYSGGIKGKSNIVNAKYHQGNHYFFSTDLTNFFPSISAKMIYQSLIKVGYSADVSNIITRLCTLNNELPQGIHPATFIANIVTMEMTSELKNFCEQYNITFSIYVDDLNFSSKTDFADKTNEIVRIIIKYGFKINRKKTFYKRGKALITGCIVRQNKVTPPSYVYYNFNRESISNKKEAIERYINRFNH